MHETITDLYELQTILENMKRDLPALRQECLDAAEQIYDSNDSIGPETWKRIGDLVEKMDQLYRQSRLVTDALANLPDNDELLAALDHFVRTFPEQFQAMNACMDQEDHRDAADCLKYELSETIRGLAVALGDELEVMEARYRKNLEYLKEKFPKVYAEVAEIEPDWTNYQIVFSRTGMPNLKIRTEENRWIKFYSSHDPEAEVTRWASKLAGELGDSPDIMLYGFGFGYHLLMLSMRLPNMRISIYEPDTQIFVAAMHAIDLEQLLSRVQIISLLVGDDKIRREQLFFKFMKMSGAKPSAHAIPVYQKLYARNMIAFSEDAKTASMAYFSSIVTYKRFGLEWLQNRMYNLPHILNSTSVSNYKGLLAGKTAVIVGAGPSLEPDVSILRELKQHAVIIAAGSTIQSLMHFGIEPHLLVLIDGGKINLRIYTNPAVRSIPLLFAPAAQYEVVDLYDPLKIIHFFLDEDLTTQYMMGFTEEDPLFEPVPSVTGNAIETAIYMGCTEIVLVGQDLSYPSDVMYAPGAKHLSPAAQERALNNAKYTVENVNGGHNRATHGLVVTLRSIESLIDKYPDIVFTNTARYGAKISGTTWEPLEHVLDRVRDQTIPGDIIKRYLGVPGALYGEQRKRQVKARLAILEREVGIFEQRLDHIAGKLEKLPDLGKRRSMKCIQYMRDIEKEWAKVSVSVPFLTLMTTLAMNAIREFDRDRPELEKETDVVRKAQLFVDILGSLVQTMQSCMPDVKELLRVATERMKD